MSDGRSRCKFSCIVRRAAPSAVFYLVVLIPRANAQGAVGVMTTALTFSPTTAAITTTDAPLVSTPDVTSSFNSTSTSTSLPDEPDPPGLRPATKSSSDQDERNDEVFNFYFLFLILFGVLLAAVFWWLHRHKKRRKEQLQLGGQHALARDLEGWASTRRFMHGRYGRNQQAAIIQREEGLDERGEAPPPYQARDQGTTSHSLAQGRNTGIGAVAVPLRTLRRSNSDRANPPAYQNPVQSSENETARSTPP